MAQTISSSSCSNCFALTQPSSPLSSQQLGCASIAPRRTSGRVVKCELANLSIRDYPLKQSTWLTETGHDSLVKSFKQLVLHETNSALASHFKCADAALWLTLLHCESVDALGVGGEKCLVLKRRSGFSDLYYVWVPFLGVLSVSGSYLKKLPDISEERLGSRWNPTQAAVNLAGPDNDGLRTQGRKRLANQPGSHPGAIAAWFEAAESSPEAQRWGYVKATPVTLCDDIAGMSGCLLASHDDVGDGRGGWRTINIPTHGIMSVQPCEFVLEDEGVHPPVLRPWWAAIRPTEWAVTSGLDGRRALVFAKGVSDSGRFEKGLWWAWIEGHGFQEVTNQELSGQCTDKVCFGSPDHLPLAISQGCSWH